jgi:predicted Rossmann fold flavoprotein
MKEVIIIGGGASGFFCATELAARCPELNITILEKQRAVLQKVKVSGGGRCNVTHACFENSTLLKSYPRGKAFLKKTMQLFAPKDTIQWFQEKGVTLIAESDGRMFPTTNTSETIINTFLLIASKLGIQIRTHQEVTFVEPKPSGFLLTLKNNETMCADAVLIACGGFQKKEHYGWIEQLGHSLTSPIPSLFTFNTAPHRMAQLMGISIPLGEARIVGTKFSQSGAILITHWGFSGPAILKLSAFAARELHDCCYTFSVAINWINIPEHELRENWNTLRNKQGGQTLGSRNPFTLPQRLWAYVLQEAGIEDTTKWSELNSKQQNKLIHTLTADTHSIKGKTTFKEEFVTCGGVSLSEVDANTMESKLIPNLYFGGEILDVDGITGGFNFQHAWTTGYIAACAIAQKALSLKQTRT